MLAEYSIDINLLYFALKYFVKNNYKWKNRVMNTNNNNVTWGKNYARFYIIFLFDLYWEASKSNKKREVECHNLQHDLWWEKLVGPKGVLNIQNCLRLQQIDRSGGREAPCFVNGIIATYIFSYTSYKYFIRRNFNRKLLSKRKSVTQRYQNYEQYI